MAMGRVPAATSTPTPLMSVARPSPPRRLSWLNKLASSSKKTRTMTVSSVWLSVPSTPVSGYPSPRRPHHNSVIPVQPKAQTTFFDTAISEGVLDSNVFTADLKKGAPGTYDFGYIDNSKYTGSITYAAVDTSNGFWEFTGSGYAVGSGSFQQTSIDGIADTGTTLLLLDDSIVQDYYKQVTDASYDNSQGGYTFPCSATLPNFTVGIGSFHAVIPGSYLNYAPASGSSKFQDFPRTRQRWFSLIFPRRIVLSLANARSL